MPRFHEPDLGADPDSPFARDAANKLVRRSYWLDMNDRTLVIVMVNGIGAHLTKRREESAFDRSEAGASDRSSMCAGDFSAGKMITTRASEQHQVHPPVTALLHEGLCLAARLNEHVIAPVSRGIRSPMVYQATTKPFKQMWTRA
jgi:hypothetical protein